MFSPLKTRQNPKSEVPTSKTETWHISPQNTDPVMKEWTKPATCINSMYSTICSIQETLRLTSMQKSPLIGQVFFQWRNEGKVKNSNIQWQIYIFSVAASLQKIKTYLRKINETSNNEAHSQNDSHCFVSLLPVLSLLYSYKDDLFPFTVQMGENAHIFLNTA